MGHPLTPQIQMGYQYRLAWPEESARLGTKWALSSVVDNWHLMRFIVKVRHHSRHSPWSIYLKKYCMFSMKWWHCPAMMRTMKLNHLEEEDKNRERESSLHLRSLCLWQRYFPSLNYLNGVSTTSECARSSKVNLIRRPLRVSVILLVYIIGCVMSQ